MNEKTAKRIRNAVAYHPGQPKEYEAPALHKLGQIPTYETYKRTIRELGPMLKGEVPNRRLRPFKGWDPEIGEHCTLFRSEFRSGTRRQVVTRTVEKIRYGRDGRTPLRPIMQIVDVPGGDPSMPKKIAVPQFMVIPIAKPVRLKKGTAKAVYRALKKIERTLGLDRFYAQIVEESRASMAAPGAA